MWYLSLSIQKRAGSPHGLRRSHAEIFSSHTGRSSKQLGRTVRSHLRLQISKCAEQARATKKRPVQRAARLSALLPFHGPFFVSFVFVSIYSVAGRRTSLGSVTVRASPARLRWCIEECIAQLCCSGVAVGEATC